MKNCLLKNKIKKFSKIIKIR